MSNYQLQAFFGVIGTILGTILGFVLSEFATRWREDRTEKKQARAVRTLLSLEIDQNIALVNNWWNEVTDIDGPEDDPDHQRVLLARRLIELPLPSWTHKMWESQAQFLVIALTHEEIKQVSEIRGGIDTIEAIRSALTAAYAQQQEDRRSVRSSKVGSTILPFGLAHRFDAVAPRLWTECARTVSELLTGGNPLAEPPTSSAAG